MSKRQKRHRSSNFTRPERDRLVRLIDANREALLSQALDGDSIRQKQQTWEKVASEYNAACKPNQERRSAQQLRNKFRIIAREWRQAMQQQDDSSDTGDPFEDRSTVDIKVEADLASYMNHYDSDSSPPTKVRVETPEHETAQQNSNSQQTDSHPNGASQRTTLNGATKVDRSKRSIMNGLTARSSGLNLSKAEADFAEETHQQELRHRDEVHALRVAQLKETHEMELEEARLKVLLLKKTVGSEAEKLNS